MNVATGQPAKKSLLVKLSGFGHDVSGFVRRYANPFLLALLAALGLGLILYYVWAPHESTRATAAAFVELAKTPTEGIPAQDALISRVEERFTAWREATALREFWLHLGGGLIVALVVILVVEMRVRRVHQRDAESDRAAIAGLLQSTADGLQTDFATGNEQNLNQLSELAQAAATDRIRFERALTDLIREITAEREKIAADHTSFKDEVGEHVWRAVFGNMVPPELAGELAEVVRLGLIATKCKYTITVSEPRQGHLPNYLEVRLESEYDIQNITKKTMTHNVESLLGLEHGEHDYPTEAGSFPSGRIPCHEFLNIDGEYILLNDCCHMMEKPTPRLALNKTVDLAAGEVKRVSWASVLLTPITGSLINFVELLPVLGIKAKLINRAPHRIRNLYVDFNHPGWLDAVGQGSPSAELARPFLPGQGFSVIWKRWDEDTNGRGDSEAAQDQMSGAALSGGTASDAKPTSTTTESVVVSAASGDPNKS
jgi:hypothetical protein